MPAASSLLLQLQLLLLVSLQLAVLTSSSISSSSSSSSQHQCASIVPSGRVDCWPELSGATAALCAARGCCWDAAYVQQQDSVPYCYFPSDFPAYILSSRSQTAASQQLLVSKSQIGPWPRDYKQLVVQVSRHRSHTARIRIQDSTNTNRWRVPLPLSQADGGSLADADFSVDTTMQQGQRLFVKINRRSDGTPLFDTSSTTGPLIFSDQFLQLSIGIKADVVYGLGEHLGPFAKPLNQWKRLVLWNHDAAPSVSQNLYGSHNFLLAVSNNGSSFGIFLLNSNAQEVMLQPKLGSTATVTYRSIGGIFDFFVFYGPTPAQVVQQYRSLIGQPILPPLWSMGYHLCRYGFEDLNRLRFIYERNVKIGIPIDVMWADIDYMHQLKDWTFDQARFGQLPDFVRQMRAQNRNFVLIIDPGIKIEKGYPPYDIGLQAGVFMRTADNKSNIVGEVWPGEVVWPDFTHPAAMSWWQQSAKSFLASVPVSGLWIDMNEPSNFYQGSKTGCIANNSLDFPPYVPQLIGHPLIYSQTVCPSALQHLSSHYNLHNMYGYHEAKATWSLLRGRATGKMGNSRRRQFVLSRSTFPGIQRYAFHWTGDNFADWQNLRYSISSILNFNLYGIVNTGTDVCGFNSATTEELCIRWTQLGAFYPFMRNHNSLNLPDQDPAAFSPKAQDIMRSYIKLRYSMLPYMYTQMYMATVNGTTVARSLMEEYPSDAAALLIDDQFLFGSALMICPVTAAGAAERSVYFPLADRWYDATSVNRDEIQHKGKQTVMCAIDKMPMYYRGGHVIAQQLPGNDTYHQSRLMPFSLIAALDGQQRAVGHLFWDADQGDWDLDVGAYQLLQFEASAGQLVSRLQHSAAMATQMRLYSIEILGLKQQPSQVSVNGHNLKFTFNRGLLRISDGIVGVDLRKPLLVLWG